MAWAAAQAHERAVDGFYNCARALPRHERISLSKRWVSRAGEGGPCLAIENALSAHVSRIANPPADAGRRCTRGPDMARTRPIERALLLATLAALLSHGVAAPVAAVEVAGGDRSVTREAPDRRAWRACRDHAERAVPVIQVQVAESDGGYGLAGAAVLFALKVREQQVLAFTTTCTRAAGFEDAQELREGSRTGR